MAKPVLGTKRVCPETGRKFYDLDHDPIVSPYTGKSYPLSFFEDTGSSKPPAAPVKAEPEETEDEKTDVEVVSLEDADEEKTGKSKTKGEDASDGDDDENDVEIGDDDSDTFLESDDEDNDDMSDIIGDRSEGEEET